MSIGFRPKSLMGTDAPKYNPERDLAYITPTLMRTAFEHLDEANWHPELREWFKANNIHEAEVGLVCSAFAYAQSAYVTNDQSQRVETPGEALERTGFFQLPFPVRLAMFSSLGEALAGAWFRAVRDVTYVNEDTPAHTDVAEFMVMARSVARRLQHQPVELPPGAVALEDMSATVTNQKAKIKQLEDDKQTLASRVHELEHMSLWQLIRTRWSSKHKK